MIACVIVEGIAIVVLALLCWKLYGDVIGMARTMAGMPVQIPGNGTSRVISPYKKNREGDKM